MIRLHISAILLGAALLAGCVDRPPLAEPASVGSGPYLLGSGDELRIVVYDQPSLTNLYEVDQSGQVSMPLIGDVAAQDSTADELANRIEARLATAYLRDPNVTVEVANYRPFFVLGEVGDPGQFPYVPGITAETADRRRRQLHRPRQPTRRKGQPNRSWPAFRGAHAGYRAHPPGRYDLRFREPVLIVSDKSFGCLTYAAPRLPRRPAPAGGPSKCGSAIAEETLDILDRYVIANMFPIIGGVDGEIGIQ